MDPIPSLEEEDIKYKFQSMIRAEHATYAAFQRPRYTQLIRRIEQIVGHKLKKESGDYRILKRFEVRTIDGIKRLMKKGTGKMFVCTDELFDIIKKAHSDSRQKGESKTLGELAKTYANITRDQVKAFLHLCPCQLCVRTKFQTAKTPKCDLDFVSETDARESCSLPSDAETCSPYTIYEALVKQVEFPNDENVAGTSSGAYIHALAQNSVVTSNSPVPIRKKRGRPSNAGSINTSKQRVFRNGSFNENGNINAFAQKTFVANSSAPSIRKKRGRPSHSEAIDALKQCEVLMKEDDAFDEEPSRASPCDQVNGHCSYATEDAVTNGMDDQEEPINADNLGACLQQLAECQRQLLFVESRRLAIEEVRLQVDQQVAASLMEIVNHLKQNNDKTSI